MSLANKSSSRGRLQNYIIYTYQKLTKLQLKRNFRFLEFVHVSLAIYNLLTHMSEQIKIFYDVI